MKNAADKPAYIYGLIDPRNQQLRYVGKTVLIPHRRLFTHLWRARKQSHKRHSMAWLLNLEQAGGHPEIIVLEVVPPGGDWVEAEQFWIGYFKMVGADLCNHTIGGEGGTGYKQPPEVIARRIRRGAQNGSFGKPMLLQTKLALKLAGEALRADPERWKRACDNRKAAFTEEMKAIRNARICEYMAVPSNRAKADKKRAEVTRRPENRAAVGLWSKQNWQTKRDDIITAQNAGKGNEFKRKQSEARVQLWADPEWRSRQKRTKKVSDVQVSEIRRRLLDGERSMVLASEYGVDRSLISRIKTGTRRK